jgi:hypothetical protein
VNSFQWFSFHLRGWLIDRCYGLIRLLVDKPPAPSPSALERARALKTHAFTVKLSWDVDDQTYYAYIPELGVMTNADTLPDCGVRGH